VLVPFVYDLPLQQHRVGCLLPEVDVIDHNYNYGGLKILITLKKLFTETTVLMKLNTLMCFVQMAMHEVATLRINEYRNHTVG